MVRRFSDVVQVRPVEGSQQQPEAFIWKGRLYVVRDVLAQWRERRAWWREAGELDESRAQPGAGIAAAAVEQQVWRVEASPGWSFAPGVYDLAHDLAPDLDPDLASGLGHAESAHGEQWSLVRVAD